MKAESFYQRISSRKQLSTQAVRFAYKLMRKKLGLQNHPNFWQIMACIIAMSSCAVPTVASVQNANSIQSNNSNNSSTKGKTFKIIEEAIWIGNGPVNQQGNITNPKVSIVDASGKTTPIKSLSQLTPGSRLEINTALIVFERLPDYQSKYLSLLKHTGVLYRGQRCTITSLDPSNQYAANTYDLKDGVLRYFAKITRQSPSLIQLNRSESSFSLVEKARKLCHQGLYRQAQEILSPFVENVSILTSKNERSKVSLYLALGEVFYWTGDLKTALKFLQLALNETKNINESVQARILIAKAETDICNFDSAQIHLMEAMKTVSDGSHEKLELISCLSKIHLYRAQVNEARKYASMVSGNGLCLQDPTYHLMMSEIEYFAGNWNLALEHVENGLSVIEKQEIQNKCELAQFQLMKAKLCTLLLQFDKASICCLESITLFEVSTGSSSYLSAKAQHCLSKIRSSQGAYSEANEIASNTLIISTKKWGSENLLTALLNGRIAQLLRAQKKAEQCVQRYAQTIAVERSILGEINSFTPMLQADYAFAQNSFGNNKLALEQIREAMSTGLKAYGKSSTDYAYLLCKAAQVYSNLREPTLANDSIQSALEIADSGVEKFPLKAELLMARGRLRSIDKDLTHSKNDYVEALQLLTKNLSKAHPYAIDCICALAEIELKTENFSTAQELAKEAFCASQSSDLLISEGRASTGADILRTLVKVLRETKQNDEAIITLKSFIKESEKYLSSAQKSDLLTLLAEEYSESDHLDLAESTYFEALRTIADDETLDTTEAINKKQIVRRGLIEVLSKQKKFEVVDELLKRSIYEMETQLGSSFIGVAEELSQLANNEVAQGEVTKAIQAQEKVVSIYTSTLGSASNKTVQSLVALGNIHDYANHLDVAINVYQQAREKVPDAEDKRLIDVYEHLGKTERKRKNYSQALHWIHLAKRLTPESSEENKNLEELFKEIQSEKTQN